MPFLKQKSPYTRLAAIAICANLAACGSSDKESLAPQALIVTPQGPVQGVTTSADGIYNFKGLPFAAAPLGDLRWAAPRPAPSWSETRAADTFGNRCMQPESEEDGFFNRLVEGHGLGKSKNFLIKRFVAAQTPTPMSEDCLYLNVRTGNIGDGGGRPKQPVMVWIHGGGHSVGSGDLSYYQSNGLVEKGVVLVTINYRLGVLGYMSHPALSEADPNGVSGNYGTLDQIAALKWVKENISAYGGDPDNVTIFGESAGAWSVTEMMATPLAKGLFHKAIAQSGSSTYHMSQMDEDSSPYHGQGWPSGHDTGVTIAKAVGLKNPTAADLRAVSAAKLVADLPEKLYDGLHHQRDGYVFPKNVGLAFRDGDINAVPFLTGYNADEGSLFFTEGSQPTVWVEDTVPGSADALTTNLSEAFPTQAARLVELYGLDSDFMQGGTQMMGDEIFGMNVSYAAKQVEAAGQPAYMYHFSRIPPSKTQTIGAFHAADLAFVFDSAIKILGLTDDDENLTQHMVNYWTNFAKTANPNGGNYPNWPEFKAQNWMHLSANTSLPTAKVETHLRRDKLTALDEGLQIKLEGLAASGDQSSPSNSAND